MTPRAMRSLLRWLHVGSAVGLAIYLYSPLQADPLWTAVARLGLVPALGLTGAWMWQQRYFSQLLGRS